MTGRRPNLFIAGAPRSGTTAMFRLLEQHPDVSCSNPKEPHYFCTDFHAESDRHHGRAMRFPIRREPDYLALFADLSRPVVLEATPAYLYSQRAAENIHAFNPDARILVMLREPVALLASLHAKMVAYGHENLASFRQAIEAERERRNGRGLPRGLFWPSSLYYSEWVRFTDQLARFAACFPAEQLKVIVYDDFRQDNLAVYRDAARFAGLDSSFTPEPRRVNVTRSSRYPRLSRAMARLGDLPVRNLVPEPLRRRLRLGVRAVTLTAEQPKTAPPADAALRHELMARFQPEVESLGRLLGRDLAGLWGYR